MLINFYGVALIFSTFISLSDSLTAILRSQIENVNMTFQNIYVTIFNL